MKLFFSVALTFVMHVSYSQCYFTVSSSATSGFHTGDTINYGVHHVCLNSYLFYFEAGEEFGTESGKGSSKFSRQTDHMFFSKRRRNIEFIVITEKASVTEEAVEFSGAFLGLEAENELRKTLGLPQVEKETVGQHGKPNKADRTSSEILNPVSVNETILNATYINWMNDNGDESIQPEVNNYQPWIYLPLKSALNK